MPGFRRRPADTVESIARISVAFQRPGRHRNCVNRYRLSHEHRGAKEVRMAIAPPIREFLNGEDVSYVAFTHPLAYTAQEEAARAHVPGWEWAKIVVCFADDEPVQAVLPAPMAVALGRLRALAHASTLRLAREDEVASLYPDCEPGAMPPFGPLYHQRVFVEESL